MAVDAVGKTETAEATRAPAASLIVLSGPSGAGKTTVAERLCRELGLQRSVSATTRPARPGEVDGRDYFFLTEEEFQRRLAQGGFLEHARVHGRRYGTPRAPVEKALRAGKSCLLVIDPQGAFQVQKLRPDALLIFLDAPDEAAIQQRLAGRSTESPAESEARRAAGAAERQLKGRYDCCVINDDLDRTMDELRRIIASGRKPKDRRP